MAIKAEEVFQHLDKEWNWIAKDSNGGVCVFYDKPIKEFLSWDTNNAFTKLPLDIDFGTDDWTKCCVKIPIDESEWLGKLCWFWNDNEDDKLVYVLEAINISIDYKIDNPYEPIAPIAPTKHCRPLTKEEVIELTVG